MQTRRRLTYKQLRLQYLMLVSLKVLRLVSFEQFNVRGCVPTLSFKMALETNVGFIDKTEAVKLSRHRTADLSLGTNGSL